MSFLTAGSKALNPLHRFDHPDISNLWWRGTAWNDDTITWLATSVEGEELDNRLEVVESRMIFTFSGLLLPEIGMPGDKLASFYLTVGDVPDSDSASGITTYVPTRFVYDPSDSLSLPVQLIRYYISSVLFRDPLNLRRGRGSSLIRSRIQALLGSTQLTVQEWDWMYEKRLMHGRRDSQDNAFTRFSLSPNLGLLPPRPALSGATPVDYLSGLLVDNLNTYSRELDGELNPKVVARVKDAVLNASCWVQGYNSKPEHLTAIHSALDELAHSLSRLFSEDERGQGSYFHPVSRLLQLMMQLHHHPNFPGEARSEGYDILMARLDEEEVLEMKQSSIFPYPTFVGDITAAGAPFRFAPEVVAVETGLDGAPPRDMYEVGRMDDAPLLHALLNYKQEEAAILFRNFVLRPYRYYDCQRAVLLAPLFGHFFEELREQYGKEVPLEWILAAASEPSNDEN